MLTVQTCGSLLWGFSMLCFAAGVGAGYGIAFLKFYRD